MLSPCTVAAHWAWPGSHATKACGLPWHVRARLSKWQRLQSNGCILQFFFLHKPPNSYERVSVKKKKKKFKKYPNSQNGRLGRGVWQFFFLHKSSHPIYKYFLIHPNLFFYKHINSLQLSPSLLSLQISNSKNLHSTILTLSNAKLKQLTSSRFKFSSLELKGKKKSKHHPSKSKCTWPSLLFLYK